MSETNQVVTPKFRVSFPQVFEAKHDMSGNGPFYSIQMLFPKDTDITELKRLFAATAKAKFGDDWKDKVTKIPFRDGDEKTWESHKGHIFVNAKSKYQPGVVDQNLKDIISPSDFYGGCYARATVTAYAYDTAGNKGVAFGLQNIQKMADGEPLNGRTKAKDDFGVIEGYDSVDTSQLDDSDLDF